MAEGVSWSAVIDQPVAVAVVREAVERDEVAHAWLFVGPPGVGQREVARALAAALNCPDASDAEGCGRCSVCRRIVAGTFPAARDLEPEGAAHLVDAVREEWIPLASRTLAEGRRKVLRVVAAERMNEGAQNAFLKVLEEPPPSVVWVLDAEDDRELLDTVVSRCRRVDFRGWTAAALTERARALGIAEAKVGALARAAMGSPARLADLADPDVAARRERDLALVGELAARGPAAVVPLAKEIHDWARSRTAARKQANDEELDRLEEAFAGEWPPGVKRRMEQRFERAAREERVRGLGAVLDDLASYLRDLLAGSGKPVNADAADLLVRDRARVPPSVALDALAAVDECRDALDRAGQADLHLERLLLQIAVALHHTR